MGLEFLDIFLTRGRWYCRNKKELWQFGGLERTKLVVKIHLSLDPIRIVRPRAFENLPGSLVVFRSAGLTS